jgi:hypothetical protein
MSPTAANSTAKWFSPFRFGLMLALLIFATFPQVLLGIESFVARDFGFFVYPLAHFQRDCFWHGELPFWNPYNNCGVPFLAQWNTMPLYPPALFYLTLPFNWALSNFSLLHLWWAGLGMYFLARRWTGNNFAAAFAGTAFAFNGFTLNLLMWPSHIATFSWLPWVILCAEAAGREGGRKIFLAGIVGALQMLAGGPETILLTWLTVSALWLQQFIGGETARGKMFWRFPLVVLLVFGLSAAQLLPFLDLVAHAQRESGYTDLRWSMPGFGLANFLVPMAFGMTAMEGIFFQQGQYWTSSYYLGMGTLWLAVLAVFLMVGRDSVEPKLKLKLRLLGFIAVVALLCALGENTPFYPFLRKIIPQLSFITYPIKFVMLVIFAAPLLAAIVIANFEQLRKKFYSVGVILLLLTGAVIFWTQHSPLPSDNTSATLANGISRAALLLLSGVALFLLARKTESPWLRFAPLTLLLVAWLDVLTHEPKQNPTVSPNIFEQNLVRTKLAMNPQPELGGARAMLSPQAALELTLFAVSDAKNNFLAKRVGYCANANLLDGVPKVDGFFSLTPGEFDRLLRTVYENPQRDFSALMDFMGVAQVTSYTNLLAWQARTNFLPLVTGGQKPVFADAAPAEKTTLMLEHFQPRTEVLLSSADRVAFATTNAGAVQISHLKFSNTTVEFDADAAADSLAVVAQTFHHNWRATVDAQPTKIFCANAAFQAVPISAGSHHVLLRYRDDAFRTGLGLTLVALFVTGIGLCWRKIKDV